MHAQNQHVDNDAVLSGTNAIAAALDTSASTILRLIRDGLLRAHKMPGRGPTSPWRVDRTELARFKRAMRNGEIAEHLEAAE